MLICVLSLVCRKHLEKSGNLMRTGKWPSYILQASGRNFTKLLLGALEATYELIGFEDRGVKVTVPAKLTGLHT